VYTNRWDPAKQAKKLPVLLGGEALVVWSELSAEQKDDIAQV